jgi:hypothetical protein
MHDNISRLLWWLYDTNTKKWLYKNSDHEKIKEFKYTISIQIVVVAYNVTHLLEWSIILFLL